MRFRLLITCLFLFAGISPIFAGNRWRQRARFQQHPVTRHPVAVRRQPIMVDPRSTPFFFVDPSGRDAYGYDPYRYGTFEMYNHLDDVYLRQRYRYHTFFPGRRRSR